MAEVKVETGEKNGKLYHFLALQSLSYGHGFGFWWEGGKLNKSKAVCRLCQKEYSYQGLCYFK